MPSELRSRSAKELRWIKILADWKRSGQTATAYCRERHLSESMFWFWKREIPHRRRSPGRDKRSNSPAIRLVPVRVVREASQKHPSIELVLGGGATVRLFSGFDPEALRELITFFEGNA